ncbi:MAG: hypothetical protein ACI3YC_00440 [Alloprevotella sp.]
MKHILFLFLLSSLLLHAADDKSRFQEAEQLRNAAQLELEGGDDVEAQQKMLHALDLFRKLKNTEVKQSLCLYSLCISHFNQRNLKAMAAHLADMKTLAARHPDNKFVNYDYLSVLAAYESALHEEHPSDSLRQCFMTHFKQAIARQEQMTWKEMTEHKVNPMYNYMNVATLYDLAFDPPVIDSMQLYIHKALAADAHGWGLPTDHTEGRISALDLQAWIYLYRKDYARAEKQEQEVLRLIDSVAAVKKNTVVTERGEAYDFFVTLYEEMGQTDKALHFQKLKTEWVAQRFQIEKTRAIQEIETRHETAEKNRDIRELHRKNQNLLVLCVGLLILLVLLTVLVVIRRRLREQRLYTEALTSETVEASAHASLQLLADTLGTDKVNLADAHRLMQKAEKPLTIVDKKYLLCFLQGEDVKTIAARFHVEPASVYTVRYRMKKKFPKDENLPF